MATHGIPVRAATRNPIDYPLDQDTPGANALVVYEQPALVVPAGADPKWVEWWARPVHQLYPVTRTLALPAPSAPPAPPQAKRNTKASFAFPWWVLLFCVFFALGVASYEAVCSPGHNLVFHLTRDLAVGFIFGCLPIFAAALGRQFIFIMVFAAVNAALVASMWEALR
jgi:hypothetical protein